MFAYMQADVNVPGLAQATTAFREAQDLAAQLLPGSHPVRLSVEVEYVAYIYDCLHEAEQSRRRAKAAIRAVYEAQEGMDDESFVDASELVSMYVLVHPIETFHAGPDLLMNISRSAFS